MYSGKEKISLIIDMCRTFHRSKKQDQSLTKNFMDYNKTYEELNMLLPFSPNVKVQQTQREKIANAITLPSKYNSVKAQILSNPEISSFQETFSRILHTKISSPTLPSTQLRSALVGQNIGESEKQQYRNSGQL